MTGSFPWDPAPRILTQVDMYLWNVQEFLIELRKTNTTIPMSAADSLQRLDHRERWLREELRKEVEWYRNLQRIIRHIEGWP